MAQDATGTPTSLGIPKFNTAVDAPSGKGGNAQMDAIDILVAARISKPVGIAAGEAAIWDGAAFVRSSVTKLLASGVTGLAARDSAQSIAAANTDLAFNGGSAPVSYMLLNTTNAAATVRSLAAGAYDGQRIIIRNSGTTIVVFKHALAGGTGKSLYMRNTADVTVAIGEAYEFVYDSPSNLWIEISRDVATTGGPTITRAIAPPGSPADGDIWYYVDSLTATTVQWTFRWNAGSTNADKWEFIGGAPAYSQVLTAESAAAVTTYQALATAGPSFTVPRGGVYLVEIGSQFNGWGGATRFHSYDIGGTGAVDADGIQLVEGAAPGDATITMSNTRTKTLAAATALVSKYKTSTGTPAWANRWMRVTPVRVT